MFSTIAANRIRQFNPDAKIFVMLRNPTDLAYAYHSQAVYAQLEDRDNFEEAWHLQERRALGVDIPRGAREPKRLQYSQIASIGSQLRRLYDVFPTDQVLVIFQEKMLVDTESAFNNAISFLELPRHLPNSFERINTNKQARLPLVNQLLRSSVAKKLEIQLNTVMRGRGTGLQRFVLYLNNRRFSREPLDSQIRSELVESFIPEVELLEKLTKRDLSAWKI